MIMEQEAGEFALEMWSPEWTCGITDGDESREVKLAVFLEFMDVFDYDSDIDEGEKYHYSVAASIVAHPDSLTEEGRKAAMWDGADQAYISDMHHNRGGVLVDLDWCRSASEDWTNIDYEQVDKEYRFASWDDAERFVNKILKPRLDGMMAMIGFYLDQPINAIGSTGWDMIESMVYGNDFTKNAFAKMAKSVGEY